LLQIISGHTSWVNSVAFSPDGKKLASGLDNGMVQLWDVETLTEEKGTDMAAQATNILNTQGSNNLSFGDAGFLCNRWKRLVWLPAINRGHAFAMHGNTIAVGSCSSSVTVFQFSM
jgi:WD40 repeat protein